MEIKNPDTQLMVVVERIKTAILQSQERAARNVNASQLALYFSVGRYISVNSRIQKWGNGAVKTISEQLQKELPGLKGFSESSIRNMRQFYEEWNCALFTRPANDYAVSKPIQQPSAVGLQQSDRQDDTIQQPVAVELENSSDEQLDALLQPSELDFHRNIFDIQSAYYFVSISFTHHMEILFKTDSIEQRLFYIRKTAEYKWDKYTLRDILKQDLYHHQSTMPNNFLKNMPKRVQALKAIELFKDEYLLDYINVEELGVRDQADLDEKIVENAIIHNVKNFIMMFGKDFTFVGNQYHLEKFGENEYIDLLFYNRELACLVAVELKKGKFRPAYLGQLQSYLQILDVEVRKPNENRLLALFSAVRSTRHTSSLSSKSTIVRWVSLHTARRRICLKDCVMRCQTLNN